MSVEEGASVAWGDYSVCRPERWQPGDRHLIGVLPGEGVGRSVTGAALDVLATVERVFGYSFDVRFGGSIGKQAEAECGAALSEEVAHFCSDIFAAGGAILAGAGGGRFVYDVRKRFELFCKLSPIRPFQSLCHAGRFLPEYLSEVDLLVVRDNLGGIYQGTWSTRREADGQQRAEHTFSYLEGDVMRILRVAARLASERRGKLAVIHKESGVPAVSALWRRCADVAADQFGIEYCMLDIDYAAYKVVCEADVLDVVVAPNLFGDVLGDLAAALLSSRGNSFSGSFSADGAAVYQTNHGAAFDLEGSDRANPVGQILSLAMLLSESFGLNVVAAHIRNAVEDVWSRGVRTFDVAQPGCRVVGTRAMTRWICNSFVALSGHDAHESRACADRRTA